MTQRWWPDTCKCIIDSNVSPTVDGVFIRRCLIHPTGSPGDVEAHNKQAKFRFLTLDKDLLASSLRKINNKEQLTGLETAEQAKADIITTRKRSEYLRS